MRPADSYPDESRDALAAFLSEAVARLDDVLRLAPKNRFQEVDEAERAIVRLRDGLIDRLRRERDADQARWLRKALARVNAAISLVTGVEYPGAGVQGSSLEQARGALQDLLGVTKSLP